MLEGRTPAPMSSKAATKQHRQQLRKRTAAARHVDSTSDDNASEASNSNMKGRPTLHAAAPITTSFLKHSGGDEDDTAAARACRSAWCPVIVSVFIPILAFAVFCAYYRVLWFAPRDSLAGIVIANTPAETRNGGRTSGKVIGGAGGDDAGDEERLVVSAPQTYSSGKHPHRVLEGSKAVPPPRPSDGRVPRLDWPDMDKHVPEELRDIPTSQRRIELKPALAEQIDVALQEQMQRVTSKRLPRIFNGGVGLSSSPEQGPKTPADVLWRGRFRWNQQVIQDLVPRIVDVYEHESPFFCYENAKKRLPHLKSHGTPRAWAGQRLRSKAAEKGEEHHATAAVKKSTLQTKDLFAAWNAQQSISDRSGSNDKNGVQRRFYTLLGSIAPGSSLEPLMHDVTPNGFAAPENPNSINLFYLGQGHKQVLRSHYDATHTNLLIVSGTVKVILHPPHLWKEMRVYPYHHPRHGQSQRPFLEHPNEDDETRLRMHAWTAELLPGDMLYIPPFWFWEEECSDARAASDETGSQGTRMAGCHSVVAWSDSYESFAVAVLNEVVCPTSVCPKNTLYRKGDILSVPEPAERKRRAAVAAVLMRLLVDQLTGHSVVQRGGGSGSNDGYIDTYLLQNRYGEFLKTMKCDDHKFDLSKCPRNGTLAKSEQMEVSLAMSKIYSTFQKLDEVAHGTRHLMLLNIIEEGTRRAIGLSRSCAFWRCLGEGRAWAIDKPRDDVSAAR